MYVHIFPITHSITASQNKPSNKKMSKYYFDKKAATRAINWIEKYITHVKGELAGKPLTLEKWQKDDIVSPIFGWKDKLTGLRQYRTVYVEIPRKNAKSTLAAGIGLYLLMADNEPGAEIYSAAADRTQAGIVFDVARSMTNQRRALSSRAKVFRNAISYEKNGSFYKAISADAKTKHGFNAHGIIFDELHTQPNRELFDVLTTSVGSRRQPLTLLLTTAGHDKNTICWEIHEYARKVKAGIIQDDTFLGIVYTSDRDSDIFSIETWKTANPGFGSIVKRDYIEGQANKIKNEPSFEATFRRLHLNQWTDAEDTFITDQDWMKCNIRPPRTDSKLVYAGLDLASTRDISALVLIYKNDDDTIDVLPYFWMPEDTAKARSSSADVNYLEWIRQGYIIPTPGNVTDYNIIKKTILELHQKQPFTGFGYDAWNSSQLVNDLMSEGIENNIFDKVTMYMSVLSEPTKKLERLVMQQKINHAGNPVLRWMMSNVMIVRDSNDNIRPDKSKSKEKIDGIIALIIALATMMSEPGGPNLDEIYGEKGFDSV